MLRLEPQRCGQGENSRADPGAGQEKERQGERQGERKEERQRRKN